MAAAAAIALMQTVGGAQQAASIAPPLMRAIEQDLNQKFPNAILSANDLVQAIVQGNITYSEAFAFFEKLGLNAQMMKILYDNVKPKLGIADVILAERRTIPTPETLEEALRKAGFEPKYADTFRRLSEHVPGVEDVIRFAVREVYSSAERQKLGLDEDFPDRMKQEAAKVGMSESTARDYWAAHWQLPSVTQANEMLHRGVIDKPQYDALLKALDFSPTWRTKLAEISYNPLTRVDVRRAYSIGVMSEDDVYKAYLDDGYNETNARILTDFTVQDVSQDLHGSSRALVVTSYKEGIIDKETAQQLLDELNTGETAIALILAEADYDIMIKTLKDEEKVLTENVREGEMTVEEALLELQTLDPPATYMQNARARLRKVALSVRKSPSLADLKRWYKAGIVEKAYFLSRLELLGYNSDDAGRYAQEIDSKIAQPGEGGING